MMIRKWMALACSVSLVALLTAGISVAAVQDEEESELHKIMTEVSSTNNRINRAVRTPITFKKADNGKDIAEHAKTLVELGKKARERKEAIEKAKDIENAEEQWVTLMDEFIKHTEELAKASEAGNQPAARAAHQSVKKACADCHKVFRIEEDF